MPETLAQKVRAKFPGAYDDLSDQQLESSVRAKFPGVYDDMPSTPATPAAKPSLMDRDRAFASTIDGAVQDFKTGVVKGVGNTVVGLGNLAYDYIPGVKRASDAVQQAVAGDVRPADPMFQAARQELKPTNRTQAIGQGAEQIAEYFIPGTQAERIAGKIATKVPNYVRLLPEMVTQSAASASVATAQGQDPRTAAVAGAVMPVLSRPIGAAVGWATSRAEPWVRAAIKPTVTAMKRVAGAAQTGIDVQAERLVRFVIENKVTTAGKARAILETAEKELQGLLSAKNPATDAPQRAIRYLTALERSASKQGLPAQDVATIRNAAAEVLESGMGEDVVTMVPTPHPTLVGPNGQPITVLVPQTSRALRTDVTAKEALERARANSQWDTRKAWGEQKGAQTEASKSVERAQRDAVKAAVPEAKPILQRQGQAIKATEVLDRMEFRTANRDAASLPAHVIAAGELAAGHVPIVSFAANWLRNNQLKAGLWSEALRKGVASNNGKLVAEAFRRLGVAVPAEAAAQR